MTEPTIEDAIAAFSSWAGTLSSMAYDYQEAKYYRLAIRALEEMRERETEESLAIWNRRFGDILLDYPDPGDGCSGTVTYKGVEYFFRIGNSRPFTFKPSTWRDVTAGEMWDKKQSIISDFETWDQEYIRRLAMQITRENPDSTHQAIGHEWR